MLLFLHIPFLFKLFELAKYSVSCWCPTSSRNIPKSPLHGSNVVRFGEQNNNFGSLLNRKATVIFCFTELPLSQWL